MYDIYSPFNLEEHKKHFVNYLEAIIDRDGTIMYAIPSHQELATKLACAELGVDRKTLEEMCPKEYYFDYMTWLLMRFDGVAVWTNHCNAPNPNKRQIAVLRLLKLHGVYKGIIPDMISGS